MLEHLDRPDRALANMARMLAPGGQLVIGCPNRHSLKGFITRFTPHAFHVWCYRRLRGLPDAGKPGHGPFPAPMKREMGLKAIEAAAQRLGLDTLSRQLYSCETVQELKGRHPWLHALYAPLALLVGAWTLPVGAAASTDFVLVLRRSGERRARPKVAQAA